MAVCPLSELIFPDFHLPTQIFLKPDILKSAGNILSAIGSRAVIITTASDFDRLEKPLMQLVSVLEYSGIQSIIFDEIPEISNTEFVDTAVYFTKKTNCDMVIGFGGIESINVAKLVSLLSTNFLFCEDLLNGNETGNIAPPMTLITIPSHPLYGFEILPLVFTFDINQSVKKVYHNLSIYPMITIIDPNISIYVTDETTAFSGLAVLSLSTESIISKVTSEFTNTYALKSIDLLFKHLINAHRDNHNPSHRYPIAISSILCGVAFSLSFLSITMSISMAIASHTNTNVEKWMGIILPHVMEYNLTSSPGRYVQMAKVMDEDVREITVIEAAIKAIEGVRRIAFDLDIPPRLSQFGISKNEFTSIANLAASYPFIENAPRHLNRDEIETILIAAY